MSAYMVDREHIRYLVDAAMSHELGHGHTFYWYFNGESHTLQAGDYESAAKIGQMLWDENRRSIEHRYPDTLEDWSNAPGPGDEDLVYDHHRPIYFHGHLNPVQVLKACSCYSYQACEHPGWEESEAKVFIEALQHRAVGTLPGYEEAEWGAPKYVYA